MKSVTVITIVISATGSNITTNVVSSGGNCCNNTPEANCHISRPLSAFRDFVVLNLKTTKMFTIKSLLSLRNLLNGANTRGLRQTINQIKTEYDTEYLTNPANFDYIKSNIQKRKGVGDIDRIPDLVNELNRTTDDATRQNLQHQLETALKTIPNLTHPDVVNYGDHPKEIDSIGSKRTFDFKPKSFEELCRLLNILRTKELGNLNGSRSYYLMNELAKMVSLFDFSCCSPG